jgi:hypothetical protein
MIATAVEPMAIPISVFLRKKFQCEMGDRGLKRSTPKKHAETMNVPRHHASLKYSGQ